MPCEIVVAPGGIVMVVKLVHPPNALLSMLVKSDGSVMFRKFVHPLNALLPTLDVQTRLMAEYGRVGNQCHESAMSGAEDSVNGQVMCHSASAWPGGSASNPPDLWLCNQCRWY